MSEKLPRQYLHGSRAKFTPGETIYPHGSSGFGRSRAPMVAGAERRPDADEWVYLTTDINGAWLYAYESTVDGEPAVYFVLPLSDIERDPEHSSHMPAYRCRSAVVLAVDRQPPFSQEEAARKWIQENSSLVAVQRADETKETLEE